MSEVETSAPTQTRYFTDGTGTWKFPAKGSPQYRFNDEPEWGRSSFNSLASFKKAPGKSRRISPKEGEAVQSKSLRGGKEMA